VGRRQAQEAQAGTAVGGHLPAVPGPHRVEHLRRGFEVAQQRLDLRPGGGDPLVGLHDDVDLLAALAREALREYLDGRGAVAAVGRVVSVELPADPAGQADQHRHGQQPQEHDHATAAHRCACDPGEQRGPVGDDRGLGQRTGHIGS
jgi:hypothetical protein